MKQTERDNWCAYPASNSGRIHVRPYTSDIPKTVLLSTRDLEAACRRADARTASRHCRRQENDEVLDNLESNWVTVDVVVPYEVGVVAYDMTKATYDKSGLPVYGGAYLSGAKFKIASRYNGRVVERTTATEGDSKGVANLDMRRHAYDGRAGQAGGLRGIYGL